VKKIESITKLAMTVGDLVAVCDRLGKPPVEVLVTEVECNQRFLDNLDDASAEVFLHCTIKIPVYVVRDLLKEAGVVLR
jgi:hypothetical protein